MGITRYMLTGVPIAVLLAMSAMAQDEPEPDDSAETAEPTVVEDSDSTVVETDDESYLDIDEEDFTPSEEIPSDQSITFPTDI